jgi:nucleotide-binding universal stress UspA family protein
MYERILAAVDGSDTSEVALQQAIRLAQEQRALAAARGRDRRDRDEHCDAPDAGRLLEGGPQGGQPNPRGREQSRGEGAGVEPQTKLLQVRRFGALVRHVVDVIVEEAERWPADLIVIGIHGRRRLGKLLLGSVADAAVRMSRIPVLLTRGPARRAKHRRSRESSPGNRA